MTSKVFTSRISCADGEMYYEDDQIEALRFQHSETDPK